MLYLQSTKEAASTLQSCNVLAYPTETFYGLGCLSLQSDALDALERIKPRDAKTKPYPLILGDISQLSMVAQTLPAEHISFSLIQHFWPGALTLILPALSHLDARIVGETGGVAVRVSSHPVAAKLALEAGQPIVSTSANPTGKEPPRTAKQVADYFDAKDVYVLKQEDCLGGMSSTILDCTGLDCTGLDCTGLDCTGGTIKVLREGVIPLEDLMPYLYRKT